jgi:hypothetical protein
MYGKKGFIEGHKKMKRRAHFKKGIGIISKFM